LSFKEMLRWGALARSMDEFEIVTATLPGYPVSIKGLSYWYVEPARAHEVAVNLMNGKKVDHFVEAPPAGSIAWQYIREAEEKASGDDAAGTDTGGGEVALDDTEGDNSGNGSGQQPVSENDGAAGQPEGGVIVIVDGPPAGPEQEPGEETESTPDHPAGQEEGDAGTAGEEKPEDSLLPEPEVVQTG